MQMTTAGIPSSVTTMEMLAAYSLLALQRGNPTAKVLEGQNYNDFIFQASVFTDENGLPRLVGRFSLELQTAYNTSNTALYTQVKEVTNIAKPTGF